MGVRYPNVMPAKAGIQAFLLDSRQKHAGMTFGTSGTLLHGSVLSGILNSLLELPFTHGDLDFDF